MTDLATRIRQLDRASAYEAAQLLAADLGADPDAQRPDHPVLTDPLAHQDDLEDLAKVLLLASADIDPEAVERALGGAGHRQFVLGGAELIALAVLVVGGLQVVVSRGKTGEESTVTVERDADGSERVSTAKKTTYGVSAGLAKLLRGVVQP